MHGTTVENWNDMLALARGSFGVVEVSVAGKPIGIRIGDMVLTGQCLAEAEIKLSIHSGEVGSPAKLGALLRFAAGTATLLGRPMFITPENLPGKPIFSISPAGHVQYPPWS